MNHFSEESAYIHVHYIYNLYLNAVVCLKLKAYSVHDSAIKLIQSYLSGRFQRVKCNGKVSNWLPLRCGVP